VCDVIVAEAVSGVRESDREQAEEWLRAYPFLESTFAIGAQAGAWRHDYARRGITISATDALIAATALEYDATLLTRNARHFPMLEITIEPLPSGGR
jgi:predicted nucleic acid-binding protein